MADVLQASLVGYLSEWEDRERACRVNSAGDVEIMTELGFRFVVPGRAVRDAQRGGPIEVFADALAEAYEKSARDWLRNGPWL